MHVGMQDGFYFLGLLGWSSGGVCWVISVSDCIHVCVTVAVFSCNMDARECSEHTGWEPVRGWPAKRGCSKVKHRCISLEMALFFFAAAASVVVVPVPEKSHESEISSIMSRAARNRNRF